MRLRVVAASGEASEPEPAAKPEKARQRQKPQEVKKPQESAKAPKTQTPRIPGYQVHQRLGRGASGDVYLAVQESLDREVALKVLSQKQEADEAFVRSFQAEARAAAALNHPNVVTVHDVGEADGVHYLTMEYMDRGSLETRVAKEGALPWPIVLGVLKDAASGLVYAESRGIVHPRHQAGQPDAEPHRRDQDRRPGAGDEQVEAETSETLSSEEEPGESQDPRARRTSSPPSRSRARRPTAAATSTPWARRPTDS